MRILERIRRCQYCGSDMTDSVSSQSYAENPFCDGCYSKRVAEATARIEAVRGKRIGWRDVGGYCEAIYENDEKARHAAT